jgi:hypothetical protein
MSAICQGGLYQQIRGRVCEILDSLCLAGVKHISHMSGHELVEDADGLQCLI